MHPIRRGAAAVLLLPSLVCAQPPAADRLEPVTVIGTRSPQDRNRLPAAVTIVTREEIDRSGAQHLADLLRAVGAAQVSDLYGDGSRATVDLRGFGDAAHSTTLILVDGRRLNNPDIAPPDLNGVALKDVERIEILHGSGTTLYGDQASGGVINIVTRAPEGFAAHIGGHAGSDAAAGAQAAVAQRWGSASARLSAEARDTDNYREHNALRHRQVLARAGWDGAATAAFLEGSWAGEHLETPGPLFAEQLRADRRQSLPQFRDDFSDTRTGALRGHVRRSLGRHWTLEADYTDRHSDNAFRLSFASGFSASGTQDRVLRSLHPRVTAALPGAWGDTALTAGVDVQHADYRLDSDAFGTQRSAQRELGAYAQAIVPLPGALEATLGGRAAHVRNDVQDAFTFAAPARLRDGETSTEAGVAWRPLAPLRLYARYDRTFRFPKVDELTSACGSTAGLAPQSGDAFDAGVEWSGARGDGRIAAYRLDLDDEIAFDGTACSGFGANVNLERTRRDGVMVEATWRLADALWLDAAAHHVDAQIRGGGLTGKDVPLVARNTARAALSGRLPGSFTARLEAQATDDRPFAGDFDNSLGRLPGFAVVNAAVAWARGAVRVEARIDNVFDRAYVEYGAAGFDATFTERESFFPSPERRLRFSARYDW